MITFTWVFLFVVTHPPLPKKVAYAIHVKDCCMLQGRTTESKPGRRNCGRIYCVPLRLW